MNVLQHNHSIHHITQRWSPGHKARDQGEGQTLSRPRTKDTDASVLQKQKKRSSKIYFRPKRSSKKFFSGDLYLRKPKKRSLQIFRKVSGVFQQNFNSSKIVLSSSKGQANFRGLEASRPRPMTSKCVLEDVLEAKDVLEDSTSDITRPGAETRFCSGGRDRGTVNLICQKNVSIIGQGAEQICATHAYHIQGFRKVAPSPWKIFVVFQNIK